MPHLFYSPSPAITNPNEILLTFRITDTVSCRLSRAQAGEGRESRAVISCVIIFQNKTCTLHLFGICCYLPSLHCHCGADKGGQDKGDLRCSFEMSGFEIWNEFEVNLRWIWSEFERNLKWIWDGFEIHFKINLKLIWGGFEMNSFPNFPPFLCSCPRIWGVLRRGRKVTDIRSEGIPGTENSLILCLQAETQQWTRGSTWDLGKGSQISRP